MTMQITVKEVACPQCGAGETHPEDDGKTVWNRRLLIRGYKVYDKGHWWSQCLVCSGHYTAELVETANHDPSKGWF